MKEVKKILCPIDFKEENKKVLSAAIGLAKAFQSELIVTHITPKFVKYSQRDLDSTPPNPFTQKLISEAHQKLEALLSDELLKGVTTTAIVLNGSAADEILKTVERYEIDMIVMGTSGREGWDHFILGSVAQNVLRGATVPVVTIKPE